MSRDGSGLRHNKAYLNGRVPVLGQQEKTFDVQAHDSPMAYPTSQLVPHEGGATLNIFGGLTKFEYFVGQALGNSAYSASAPAEMLKRVQDICDALEKHGDGTTKE